MSAAAQTEPTPPIEKIAFFKSGVRHVDHRRQGGHPDDEAPPSAGAGGVINSLELQDVMQAHYHKHIHNKRTSTEDEFTAVTDQIDLLAQRKADQEDRLNRYLQDLGVE